MRVARTLLVVVVAFGCAARVVAPDLWAGLTPGSHGVGYRVLRSSDAAAHVWYPATAAGAPMQFSDYLGDRAPQLRAFLTQTGATTATLDSLFASRMLATASPAPLQRPFPLILVAHGNGHDAGDQAVLCEYLASQGYVVVATPSPMLRTPMEREDQVGVFAEQQANELLGAIAAVAAVIPVDTQHVGVVGHSFGARAALLVAMRDPRVRAVVSLDGGIGTATASGPFRSAPSFRADAALPPILHFYEELDAFMKPDFTLLKGLNTTEATVVPTTAMHHVHFTTYGFIAARFPDIAKATSATDATIGDVITVHKRTATFLHKFLQ